MQEVEFRDRFIAALGPWAPERADLLARHAWLVAEKNKVMNLTRVTEPEAMAVRHGLDSLAAVPILVGTEDAPVTRVLDLGTGAGWPGLAAAIALPGLQVTLLDGTRKKITFLEEVVKDLGLTDDVTCVWSRFEDYIREHRRGYDLVLARAVGPVSRLLEWTTNRWFGPLVLWKGPRFEDELDDAHALMTKRKIGVTMDMAYELPGDDIERRLAVIDFTG